MWLLAEDDSDIRTVVAMMMTVWGENPLPFPDGKSAWAWLDSVENGTFGGPLPELALMDIRMPGYTGDQIAARMRSIEQLKDIPIILMTAFSMTEAEIAALRERCGVDHLLEKPLPDLDVFRSLLYKVRDERRELQKQAYAAPVTTPETPAQPTAESSVPASIPVEAPPPPAPESASATAAPAGAAPLPLEAQSIPATPPAQPPTAPTASTIPTVSQPDDPPAPPAAKAPPQTGS